MYIYMYIYEYIRMNICVFEHIFIYDKYMFIYVCMDIQHVYIWVHAYMHICVLKRECARTSNIDRERLQQ